MEPGVGGSSAIVPLTPASPGRPPSIDGRGNRDVTGELSFTGVATVLSEFVRILDNRDGACAVEETLWILRWPGDMGDEVSDVLRPTSTLLRRAGDGSLEGKSTVILDLITRGVES